MLGRGPLGHALSVVVPADCETPLNVWQSVADADADADAGVVAMWRDNTANSKCQVAPSLPLSTKISS